MKKVLNKIHTGIFLILVAGMPVLVVVPEQYWFEKRVVLAVATVVLLALWASRTWRIGRIGPIGPIREAGWPLVAAAMAVAAVVPAGRIANLMAPELWVGLGAVVAYFATKSTTTSSKIIKWGFFAAAAGMVAAAAVTAAGIGRIGQIGPIREQATATLEILKRSPIWGEFRELRVARLGILQIASGLGILGILGTLALIYQLGLKSVKGILKSSSVWWKALNILVLVLLVGFLVLPNPALTLWPLAVVAALACGITSGATEKGKEGKIGGIRGFVWAALVGLLVVTFLGSSFGLGKVVWGELKFREALAAANRNEGITTYYALLEAIERNPYEVRYRLLASQIDIALASSIAANAAEEMAAEDQNNILILIQQAVVEGKQAIKLDPENSYLWQNLASIYRGLVGVAGGAEDWALRSYQRAAELNPSDPNSWVGVGEIHFFSGNFQGAADAFLEATWTSPDFARAHYNLAIAYNALGEPDRAIESLERVLELLPEDSEDREQVEKDLTFLKGDQGEQGEMGIEGTGETEELKEATTSAEVQPPPPPVGPEEATASAETKPIEVVR